MEKYLLEQTEICGRTFCGYCREGCPVLRELEFESFSMRGKLMLLRELLEGKLQPSKDLGERFYACVCCGQCSVRCPSELDTVSIIEASRAYLVELGLVPPKVRDFLENISKHGNPWKLPRKKRGEWAKGMKIRQYEPGDEFLYYVGCTGSYDTRSNEIARALGEVLLKGGVSFGVLGSNEICDGNDVKMLGEEGLFKLLADHNIRMFKKLGVKKIVTLSPHAYNVIKNYYPQYGGKFEVRHYTQLLWEIIKGGKLDVSKELKARVTYHDPCFLGRHNKVYDAPREILRSIPGIELVEMERNRENSFCCGGGAANFYTGLLGGRENSPNRIRVREAYDTGAEILAVACPNCMTMLEDAVREEKLEGKLTVKCISEIVRESCY